MASSLPQNQPQTEIEASSSLPQNQPQTEIEVEGSPPTSNMDASSASTSTAANFNNNQPYDIFINHRGPDTKKNFASHLYRRFLLHGVQVFLDQKELQQGDNFDSQIKAAIKSASVHVAIFSPGYAESRWCLEELCLMLETGATIIPVFYNVKPSELRWTRDQKSLYGQALHKHEQKQRYDYVTLENWRNALSHVAGKSGFELEACNGDEGELLEKVVERVLKKVKRPGLDVAKYPTGLDEKVKDFEKTVVLKQQLSGKPPIFGIVGLGGVGKTTLAKEIFNRNNSSNSKLCFLSDIRDSAEKGSLHLLQRKLLKSLSNLDEAIDNVHEGTGMLKKYLSYSNALVILDDVNDESQVDALLPEVEIAVCSSSLIIITSRDKAVLRRARVEETSIYKLNGLRTEHSRELFCSYAFSRPHPLPGFESLVEKFTEACGGLPLSLKVFGALLYGKDDQSDWQTQLDSLQQILPDKIQRRLKISYDSLIEEERQIFLDIAIFFIGENRDTALGLWSGSGRKGYQGFQNLHNKCLVELDSENNIHMHDHLRDMGRDIAKDSNLPLRICCSFQNIEDLLQESYNEQLLKAVRGIMVAPTAHRDPGYNYVSLPNRKFSKFSWLKRSSHELLASYVKRPLNKLLNTRPRFHGVSLLDAEDSHMERILRRVQSPNVIWIRWYSCPFSSLPSWIPMKNLTYLEVGGSVLETLWHGQSQVPFKLRELRIYAPLSKIPKSIGQLKHLERIVILSRPINLKMLPEEFCLLRSLKALDLVWFSELKSLPDSFGDLMNLEHLNLSGCCNLERLPNSFGNLIRLKYLNLNCCSKITISSETLGYISTLEHLDLFHCTKIEVLPLQVAHQRSLAVLDLRYTNLKELPGAMGDLRDLEVLRFGGSELHSLPPSLGELNVKKLEISCCKELKYLPDFVGLLTQLTDLTIHWCPLRELPFKKIEGQRETSAESSLKEFMPRLQYFTMEKTEISEMSFGEGVCPNLDLLEIHNCNNLKKIELCGLAKLQKLIIVSCSELEELPSLEHCRSLKSVNVSRCPKLQLKEEIVRQLTQQGSTICII